ncbi:hypothetical protein T11_12110 [Trichinella zimbabwensis]|uniref:Uncharacterized protein n=1 Tax=Trichinella zimbabwensis TaxID=268475 RepID=A0A0V1HXG7_9BILA|nr:hypothetical protein T11_12110 [Trichinella zimbabwensis]
MPAFRPVFSDTSIFSVALLGDGCPYALAFRRGLGSALVSTLAGHLVCHSRWSTGSRIFRPRPHTTPYKVCQASQAIDQRPCRMRL